MRKSDEDWVKKCMNIRVEDRRLVGKNKKDMDRECGSRYGRTRDRQRRHPLQEEMETECYEEEVQPYWKTDYKRIIIIYHIAIGQKKLCIMMFLLLIYMLLL